MVVKNTFILNNNDINNVRKKLQKINDEKKCNLLEWTKVLDIFTGGFYSNASKVCMDKENCKKHMIVKTTILDNDTTNKDYNNESTALEYISKKSRNINWQWYPEIIDEYLCGCSILEPIKIGVRIMPMYALPMYDILTEMKPEYYKFKTSEKWWFTIIKQVISIFTEMDKLGIQHNDLHFNNWFVQDLENPKLMLIDWGFVSSKNNIGLENYKSQMGSWPPNVPFDTRYDGTNTHFFIPGKDLYTFFYQIIESNDTALPSVVMNLANTICMMHNVYNTTITPNNLHYLIRLKHPKSLLDINNIILNDLKINKNNVKFRHAGLEFSELKNENKNIKRKKSKSKKLRRRSKKQFFRINGL